MMFMNRWIISAFGLSFAVAIMGVICAAGPRDASHNIAPAKIKDIKAYCLDFNWGGRRKFAEPGTWADADPAKHVAWYKNGFVPAQPGLKHDFLPEMVKLGHKEGMLVIGYFCIAANSKWAKDHPDLSYGAPSTYHIPYTDEYLAYLAESIGDAVGKSGIDGIMIDWVWQPNRGATRGKWLDCEKKLYAQLMGKAYPAGGKLTGKQGVAYGRKAIDRCWKTIRKAAKDANPKCIIWLTSNNTTHPHVVNSAMYKETDWLMNEAGDIKRVQAVKPMIGKHTRLITCLARWNRQDATAIVPAALKEGIGLYGFARPGADSLLPLEPLLTRPVKELRGDRRNIAVLARAYHGASVDSVRNDKGEFVQPTK